MHTILDYVVQIYKRNYLYVVLLFQAHIDTISIVPTVEAFMHGLNRGISIDSSFVGALSSHISIVKVTTCM